MVPAVAYLLFFIPNKDILTLRVNFKLACIKVYIKNICKTSSYTLKFLWQVNINH